MHFAAFYDSNRGYCAVGAQRKGRISGFWLRTRMGGRLGGGGTAPIVVQCWAGSEARPCCNVGGDISPLSSPLCAVAAHLCPDGDVSTLASTFGIQQVWKA